MDNKVAVSVVVPVYNEELVVKETYVRLKKVMDSINESYEIIFVNDGSKDRTFEIISDICRSDENIRLLNFSRNFGHQVAISAGMDHSAGDATVVIDADLQDPPELIPDMLAKWREGYEVVYGLRLKRKGETLFKKLTAMLFYRFLTSMTDVKIPTDVGDFRLIDRKVLNVLKAMPERNRYVRGLISWIGFRQTGVTFVRDERFAGETKYPLKKMIKFATDAITSFSHKPLKIGTYVGLTLSGASFLYLIVVLIQKLFTNTTQSGWASIVAINLFFNGVLLFLFGVMGEYIGRIYDESKGRPLYILSEKVGFSEDGDNRGNVRDNNVRQ